MLNRLYESRKHDIIENREKFCADLKIAMARFFERGGQKTVLPPPTFAPIPLRKDARDASVLGSGTGLSVKLPKPTKASRSISKPKQKALYDKLKERDEQADLVHRIRLKDDFRHLGADIVESVLFMAERNLTARQIAYRVRIESQIIKSIIEYHEGLEQTGPENTKVPA